jgi:hypothetical protein
MMPKLEIYCLLYFLGEPVSAAIQTALTVQLRTVGFVGAVSSLPPRTNVSEGGLTQNPLSDKNRKKKNQCCGSGMFIPDPNFYPSRIPEPGSKNLLYSHKILKTEEYYSF